MGPCTMARCAFVPAARPTCLGSCRRASRLRFSVRSVTTNKRKRCQPLTVAHSSVLLPDVTPEANVPPAVVKTIVEYARAMPTWEVFTRAGVEIAVSVFVSVLILRAIQRATAEAVQVNCQPTLQHKRSPVRQTIPHTLCFRRTCYNSVVTPALQSC